MKPLWIGSSQTIPEGGVDRCLRLQTSVLSPATLLYSVVLTSGLDEEFLEGSDGIAQPSQLQYGTDE